jgi:Peptidyl-tRNA hydrolase
MGNSFCSKKNKLTVGSDEADWEDVDDEEEFKKLIVGKMLLLYLVGLGNPGDKYSLTRHNIGHMFIDYMLDKYGKKYTDSSFGKYFETEDAIYVRCPKYMNLSGGIIKPMKKQFRVGTY